MDWTGKVIRIIFDDLGKTMSKVGTVISVDADFIEIETSRGIEILPKDRIVRMEVEK